MPIDAVKATSPKPLRHLAEARLRDGTPPPSIGEWTTGLDALTLLHQLAGSPASAGDALKLLHELQVHQVELTLQHEQLEQSRTEISETLDRYVERFDFAPVGYFTVERDGRIIEANLAGAALFKIDRAAVCGRPLESLVAAGSHGTVRALLERLRRGNSTETCEVHAKRAGGLPRLLQAVANTSVRERCFYVTFTELPSCKTPDQLS